MKTYEIVQLPNGAGFQFQVDGKPALGCINYLSYSVAAVFAFGWLKAEVAGLERELAELKEGLRVPDIERECKQ